MRIFLPPLFMGMYHYFYLFTRLLTAFERWNCTMEAMIKRIIDMDKKAQEITEAAQKEKLNSEKEIAEKARQLRQDYLDRARHRIQINNETERARSEENWKKREAYYDQQLKRLEDTYASHHDALVEAIVGNVLAE